HEGRLPRAADPQHRQQADRRPWRKTSRTPRDLPLERPFPRRRLDHARARAGSGARRRRSESSACTPIETHTMNQTEDRNDRGHSGWLIAPVLLMTAVCANAKDNAHAKDTALATDSTAALTRTAALTSAAAPIGAPAQDAAQTVSTPSTNSNPPPQQLQEVVVTGSRIARPVTDRLEPTVVIGAGTISDRGLHDVGQALTELPGFGVQPSSQHNVQSNFGIGQSFVDLYSLGSQRTLVLVDGRRFVSSNSA